MSEIHLNFSCILLSLQLFILVEYFLYSFLLFLFFLVWFLYSSSLSKWVDEAVGGIGVVVHDNKGICVAAFAR